MTALDEQTVFVDALTNSGPVPEEIRPVLKSKVTDLWTSTFEIGTAQLVRYHRDEKDFRGFDPNRVECFKNGCMIALSFTDEAAATTFEEDLLVGPRSPLRHWPGRIYRGPYIHEKDCVSAVWALLPDPAHYEALRSLQTSRHAVNFPNDSRPKTTISDLQQGEP